MSVGKEKGGSRQGAGAYNFATCAVAAAATRATEEEPTTEGLARRGSVRLEDAADPFVADRWWMATDVRSSTRSAASSDEGSTSSSTTPNFLTRDELLLSLIHI